MIIEPVEGVARATIGGTLIAESSRALRVKEVGHAVYEPVIYFPPGDVRSELLTPLADTTFCPLKGTASYFDIEVAEPAARAAWSYQQMLDFDPRLAQIESCVAFYTEHVNVELFAV
jgi:uncharacterized protein (DUF427 family)